MLFNVKSAAKMHKSATHSKQRRTCAACSCCLGTSRYPLFHHPLYPTLYSTLLYPLLCSTLYSLPYPPLHHRLYSTLYSTPTSTLLYPLLCSTLYSLLYPVLHHLLYPLLYSLLHPHSTLPYTPPSNLLHSLPVSYTHLTLPTIYSV